MTEPHRAPVERLVEADQVLPAGWRRRSSSPATTGRQYHRLLTSRFDTGAPWSVTLLPRRRSTARRCCSVYHSFSTARLLSPADRRGKLAGRRWLCSLPEGWFRDPSFCHAHGITCSSATRSSQVSGGAVARPPAAGKGIASGLPLGAMIARDDVMTWEAARGCRSRAPRRWPRSTCNRRDEGAMANASSVGEVFLAGTARRSRSAIRSSRRCAAGRCGFGGLVRLS